MSCSNYRPVGQMKCECGAPVWEHDHTRDWTRTTGEDKRDATEGMRLREKALALVQAPVEWIRRAEQAVTEIAHTHERFTSDLVWNLIETPREPRALGVVMRAMEREGVIAITDDHQPSARKERHRAPTRIWESRIYQPPQPVSRPLSQVDLFGEEEA